MKVYIVSSAVNDNGGNVYTDISGVFTNKGKAFKKFREVHKEVKNYYEDPEDTYESGCDNFVIWESGDGAVCRSVEVIEKEVE